MSDAACSHDSLTRSAGEYVCSACRRSFVLFTDQAGIKTNLATGQAKLPVPCTPRRPKPNVTPPARTALVPSRATIGRSAITQGAKP